MNNPEPGNPYEVDRSSDARPGKRPPPPASGPSPSGPVPPGPAPSDPSVMSEPWMQARNFQPDSTDRHGPDSDQPGTESPEQSVWDEPGLSRELSGEMPDDAITWFRHYLAQVQKTSAVRAWLVTFAVISVAGPLAILGTLLAAQAGHFPIVYYSIIGPTVEELMKLALVLWIVETRPWLFRSAFQILICMVMSGLVFAAVENVVYLELRILNPTPQLVRWRWTVCVALHTGCCLIAGLGAATVWRRFQAEERPPRLKDGAPWIISAITIHGLYNFSVIMADVFKINTGLQE